MLRLALAVLGLGWVRAGAADTQKCHQLTSTKFGSPDIRTEPAADADSCCAACYKEAKCNSWTLVNFDPPGPVCHLKPEAQKEQEAMRMDPDEDKVWAPPRPPPLLASRVGGSGSGLTRSFSGRGGPAPSAAPAR